MVEKLLFNLSNFLQQQFPFSLKLIRYMIENADAEVKQKLDRSCKYFYKEAPYLIIDNIEFNEAKQRLENETHGGCIDFIDDDQIQIFLMNASNIWVTKKLTIFLRRNLDIRGNKVDVQLFDKIIRSDAKEISSNNINMPFYDYKLLSNSRKVEYLDLSKYSFVFGLDKAIVPLEDVLAMVPNAMVIRMFACHITSDTMKKLLEIPWKNKVIELSLKNVDGPLCPNLFFKFVKHIDPEASIHVDFKDKTDTFQKLYNQMVIESDERMPTIGYVASILKTPTRIQHLLSWMASFASIIEIIQGESPLPFMKPSVVPKKFEKVTFNEDNMERQYTAFPYPHMCYILQNADAETWNKLQRICKFFCKKNPYLMVDDFHSGTDNKITLTAVNNKIMFENGEEIRKFICKPLWITHSIDKAGIGGLYMKDRIDAIKISSVSLIHRRMDFIWFTKSGKVKDWNSIESFVENNDFPKMISLKEFLIHLPNVEIFRARIRGINTLYPNEPISLPQSNKIKYLEIIFHEDPIQADSLFDVLKTSLAPKALVKINIRRLIEEMDIEEFKTQMKTKLDTWKPQIDKPTFKIIS